MKIQVYVVCELCLDPPLSSVDQVFMPPPCLFNVVVLGYNLKSDIMISPEVLLLCVFFLAILFFIAVFSNAVGIFSIAVNSDVEILMIALNLERATE